MSADMSERHNEYYVRTDDIEGLKRELGARAAVHAEIPIVITGTEDGEVFTKEITYRVSEVGGEGGFLGRGVVVPQGTEAIIREVRSEAGSEYLVMDAYITADEDDSESQTEG